MLRKFSLLLFFGLVFLSVSCGKKSDVQETKKTDKNSFEWIDNLTKEDIPNFPLKGMLNGKEVQFQSVTFEKWNGPNDNVLNFSVMKPGQPCGFIEKYEGFQLMNKGNAINQGEWSKPKFSDEPKTYDAYFKFLSTDSTSFKSSSTWNCVLVVESITDKTVKGKIALCFNDDKKSWAAGKFEASICNN